MEDYSFGIVKALSPGEPEAVEPSDAATLYILLIPVDDPDRASG
jgi:hypothetical protein